MFFRPFSYFCVCARLFPADCLPEQKLKIWPFRAIIESILPFSLMMYLLFHMISYKSWSYFSQLFYAPLCLNTLFSLVSFLPWLLPFRPLGFVTPQQHGQTSVQHRSPCREKIEGHHCREKTAFLERWD